MNYPLHPMLVHFPIALLISSVLFDIIGWWSQKESFRDGALWLLIMGLISGVAAFITGNMAEEAAERVGIAESLIETHETLAMVTLGIFAVLLLGRWFIFRNQFTPKTFTAYVFIAWIGIGALSATGHFGGELVFNHGAGVNVAAVEQDVIANSRHDE